MADHHNPGRGFTPEHSQTPHAGRWRDALAAELDALVARAALEAIRKGEPGAMLSRDLAQKALRVVAGLTPPGMEKTLFLGLAGMFDKLRPGWREGGVM